MSFRTWKMKTKPLSIFCSLLLWKRTVLTGKKLDLADHHPFGVKVQVNLDVPPDMALQWNHYRAGVLHQRVSHIVKLDWLAREVVATDAEIDLSKVEHTHVFVEHVVAMNAHGREVAHSVELEDYFDRIIPETLILPADPLITFMTDSNRVETEVGLALLTICKLAQASAEVVVVESSIVREVKEVDLSAATFSLRHAVRHSAIWWENKAYRDL